MPEKEKRQVFSREKIDFWKFIIPLFLLTLMVIGDHLVLVPLSADISAATGLSIEKSGLLVAIYPMAAAVSAFLLAPFSDWLGRKNMLIFLALGFTGATFGFGFSDTIFSAFFFRTLSGVFGGPIMPNVIAFAGDTFKGPNRAKALTLIMMSFSIASIMGVPLGAWLGDAVSWKMPFWIIAAGTLLVTAAIFPMKSVDTGISKIKFFSLYKELISLWKNSNVRMVFFVQLFMILGLFGFVPNISVWLSTNYDMSATEIGLCYMQGGIGALIGNITAGWLLKKGFKLSLIAAGSVNMGVFLLLATSDLIPSVWIGVFFAGIMLGGSIRMPALQLILTEVVPINLRGRLMAMSMIVSNLGMGIGGIWSIPFLHIEKQHLYGMFSIGLVGAATLFLVPVMTWRLNRKMSGNSEAFSN